MDACKQNESNSLPFLYYLHQIIDKFTFTEISQVKHEGNVVELGRQSPFCILAEIMDVGIEHQTLLLPHTDKQKTATYVLRGGYVHC